MKYYAVIVAGGSGNRMQSEIPKQFLILHQQPVLMHTISAFSKSKYQPDILVVLNIHQHQTWENLCSLYNFTIPHKVISGGTERFYSVQNAIKEIKGESVVAVHDAVRPLTSIQLIDESYKIATEKGNAIAAITATDSIRQVTEQTNTILNREEIRLIQTPQTFNYNQLKKAYQQNFRNSFTDDASVIEYAGYPINLIEGERHNIKITYPIDLEFAEILLSKSVFKKPY